MTASKRSRDISPKTRKRAQQLRGQLTPAEQRLWTHLRGHGLGGFKFRQQHPISDFIVDFCCVECGLVIEIDGDTYAGREIEDAIRTQKLAELGYRVIRFTNDDVHARTMEVLEEILHTCVKVVPMPPPPDPPHKGGGTKRQHGVKALFDHAAQDYDRTRRQFIPCFDAFYGMALALLPERQGLRVLDVGAGTGLLSGLIRAQRPDAHLMLADVSDAMLARAQQRFADDARVDYQVVDFITGELQGQYDVVVSALALHHTPQSQLKMVFAKIYAALHPGGLFINADQVLGNTPENEAHYEAIWQAAVLERGAAQQDLNMAIERMKADRSTTLDNQLTWLCEVGFQHVECWFKEYRFAVYSGIKVK